MNTDLLRLSRRRLYSRRGMTMPELLMVVAIVAVLAALGSQGYQHYINKAETVDAMNKLKGMHAALSSYVVDKQSWPQEPDDDGGGTDEALWDWWKKELKPFGIDEVEWYSTAHLRRLNRELKQSGGKGVDIQEMKDAVSFPSIVPTSFPPGMTEPYRYQNQPWVTETGEYHGDEGVYCIMPGGAIHKILTTSQMNAMRGKGGPPKK